MPTRGRIVVIYDFVQGHRSADRARHHQHRYARYAVGCLDESVNDEVKEDRCRVD